MAYPIQFPEANAELGPPPGMSTDDCRPLPILRKDNQCISMWKLAPEEMASINLTGCVCVGVLSGQTQPPIWVEAAAPANGTNIENGRALQQGATYELGTLGLKIFLYSDEADDVEQARATTLLKRLTEAVEGYQRDHHI
ncbi:hypothetical protein LJ737_04285 [Hymenobacter sp. 15J16-1T3B]|uniref:hypothetical protein n=1 Tax=Hymenobacter sp. 15J16-1T3B TaxID=2886941 RepID=UPI001D10B935|nr:hypothetical protein [Hymenobacter sp. 15J16-1T3B]MCC3156441.1 hypothetical protein [Hymenobacter sp. 15J16-1T3B]